DQAITGTAIRPGEGIAGKVWESGEPLTVDNYRHWEGRTTVYDDYNFQAVVGVPVRWGSADAGGEPLGVLDVLADAPRTFSPDDVKLMCLFAAQAAIAIQNARLYEQVQQHAEELERRVAERTSELRTTVNLMAGREVRMAELKGVIRRLRTQLQKAGIPPLANDPLADDEI
ncbi:MAG: GAF domain-containing protein, partial [Anaerolineae bacterium]